MADFKGIYHAILGRLAITKFMAVPHYGYLVLKIPTEKGTLSLRGNVLTAHKCVTTAYVEVETTELQQRMNDAKQEAKKLSPVDLEIPVNQGKRSSEKSKEYKKI